ncbi:TIR domain-containing protein [Lysinibacillus parviboronicapiens]|uniref:TIR domain-containing protein n=1 Tax=Lysinibacillus parviboronicapiens TaxID=436516 RepID=UPI000D3C12A9|nr:TIR domain-containing protein [Lysinibacillus parviboronicapiens]
MADIINPLNIFIAWHSSFENGRNLANSIFSYYNHDINNPLSRGIGIPVFFRTGQTPLNIDLTNAEYNAVILLVDDNMVIDKQWEKYIEEIFMQVEKFNAKSIILPIAISDNAFKLSNRLPTKNFIRLYDVDSKKEDFLLSRTTHELCRLLYNIDRINHETTDEQKSPPPLKLFISHAKEDGVVVAKKLSDYMQSQSPVKTFFDANDIAIGYDFPEEIELNIQTSVLLVIHTDKYSTREWCRREILLAKKNNRPIIVVNLYEEGEERIFPYLGNLKTIRFNKDLEDKIMYEKIILITLKETLRYKYHQMFVIYLTKKFYINQVEIISQPPELLSLIKLNSSVNKLTIYPDPPLSEEEIDIITGVADDMQFYTPTYIPLLKEKGEYEIHELSFLDGLNVGISISESRNIKELGFEHIHLQDALVEFTRYLLASGASISYGGDVKYDTEFNFANILFDLATNYQQEHKRPSDQITNYVSYPIYTQISTNLLAKLSDVARFINVEPPEGLVGNHDKIYKGETIEDLYVWSRSLTLMRQRMNNDINARIILGGKLIGYKGTMPGVVEEAYLAFLHKKPVYLVGSMGGASKVIIDAISGGKPEELTEDYQFMNVKYKELYTQYNELAEQNKLELINYEKLISFFNDVGIEGLNNGLSIEENKKLFKSTNTTEMISLVLKGLMAINHQN